MGNLPAAVEQLQIGLKGGDGDFYQLSSAEARLRSCASSKRSCARKAKGRKAITVCYCVYMDIPRTSLVPGLPPMVDKIGKFEIIKELGKGATSAVYQAFDPFQNRQVAIKVVFQEALLDREHGKRYRKLFVTEASLAGKLLAPAHRCHLRRGGRDELNYIVMEHIDGTTLEQYTQHQNLLPVQSIVEIVYKCARALDYAARQGVIHRDIKPANILMTGEADIKISDLAQR